MRIDVALPPGDEVTLNEAVLDSNTAVTEIPVTKVGGVRSRKEAGGGGGRGQDPLRAASAAGARLDHNDVVCAPRVARAHRLARTARLEAPTRRWLSSPLSAGCAQGVIVRLIDVDPVFPFASVAVSVTTLVPGERRAVKLPPVPNWPSRLLVHTSAEPVSVPSSESRPVPTNAMSLVVERVSPSPGWLMTAIGGGVGVGVGVGDGVGVETVLQASPAGC